jgi:hypothetical protein
MVDSRLPRFSQALQAVILAAAFLLDARPVVPLLLVIIGAAAFGGPRYNLWAYLYRALPIEPGEPEPAAPPRFAQKIGTVFLAIATVGLYALEAETTAWWVFGWGPALVVAVLSGVAAATAFCLGCEMYLMLQRVRNRSAA